MAQEVQVVQEVPEIMLLVAHIVLEMVADVIYLVVHTAPATAAVEV